MVADTCDKTHHPHTLGDVVTVPHDGPRFGPMQSIVYKAYDGTLVPDLFWTGSVPGKQPCDSLDADDLYFPQRLRDRRAPFFVVRCNFQPVVEFGDRPSNALRIC